jgi:thiopeptide-type bacteriocin biosynthesis protein
VKCYAGTSGVDRVLADAVAPLLEPWRGGVVDRWFFVRYGDPAWHVRLRFHAAERSALCGEVLPALHDRLAPLLAEGLVARVQLDTYERETERYGGPSAIAIVEEIFTHDSDAALAIVEMLEGDDAPEARWKLTLRGMHELLVDLGFDLPQRLALVTEARASFGAEQRIDTKVERRLGDRFRAEREAIAELLDAAPDSEHPLAAGIDVFARRSAKVVSAAARLRALEAAGLVTGTLEDIASSLLHMHANRLLLSRHRQQELALHDLLARHYRSQIARANAKR